MASIPSYAVAAIATAIICLVALAYTLYSVSSVKMSQEKIAIDSAQQMPAIGEPAPANIRDEQLLSTRSLSMLVLFFQIASSVAAPQFGWSKATNSGLSAMRILQLSPDSFDVTAMSSMTITSSSQSDWPCPSSWLS